MAARAQTPSAPPPTKTPFHQQRDALLSEIAISFEQVLQNINKLNRSLEGVIAVGNEFGAVEALWSQFEGVMAKDREADAKDGKEEEEEEEETAGEEEEEGEEGGDTVVEGNGEER